MHAYEPEKAKLIGFQLFYCLNYACSECHVHLNLDLSSFSHIISLDHANQPISFFMAKLKIQIQRLECAYIPN